MANDSTSSKLSSYFGYGTLLGTEAMRDYCPSAEPVAVANYPGHQLEFRQYSDDPERSGCHVNAADDLDMYGVVYSLTDEDMATLDDLSGVGNGWFRRIPITVTTDDGQEIATTTYELVAPGPHQTPPAPYRGLVRTGAHSAGLPAAYVARLVQLLDGLAES